MKIIIPMAGMGKRMRPQTLTIPKPLIPVAGKPIVQWLVEDIVKVCGKPVSEIAFVVADFGKQVEEQLVDIARQAGARGSICSQDKALGTAHAVLCAEHALKGEVVVAFADTLFRANFSISEISSQNIIWVHKVDDPRAFGVVKTDQDGLITDFVEKPQTFVSDLAIIGIYYFNNGEELKKELQYLIDNEIKKGTEYQLTDALENMRQKGRRFSTGLVDEWLDCGNKEATLITNRRLLETMQDKKPVDSSGLQNTIVIEPCVFGNNIVANNSVIGPYVSLGDNVVVENSVISDSIIREDSKISNVVLTNSLLGANAVVHGKASKLHVSDFSELL
jgi:glucose-1-phosphate thymidylyltransferase